MAKWTATKGDLKVTVLNEIQIRPYAANGWDVKELTEKGEKAKAPDPEPEAPETPKAEKPEKK